MHSKKLKEEIYIEILSWPVQKISFITITVLVTIRYFFYNYGRVVKLNNVCNKIMSFFYHDIRQRDRMQSKCRLMPIPDCVVWNKQPYLEIVSPLQCSDNLDSL